MEKLARKDQKLTSVYLTVKQDIETLREEILSHQNKLKLNERKSVKDLRKYLRCYKVIVHKDTKVVSNECLLRTLT